MDIFIARQPIFNIDKRVFAYELLYRGTATSTLSNTSGNRATTSVLSTVFLTEGVDKISGSKPCFINFTKDLLLQNIASTFPKTFVVIEILEDVPPTAQVVDICRKLKNDGYTLALDDFIYDVSMEPLLAIADIIKFDLRLSSPFAIHKTINLLSKYKLKYLAEKVETYEEFVQMAKLGCTYFQGYFFCQPESIRIKEIDSAKINQIRLLAEINQKVTSRNRLESIIQRDAGLAYKLLRYINSSYFYRLHRIDSIAHAMTYLGEKEIRRFLILVLISEIATDKPTELLKLAVVRAKMCELLAQEANMKDKEQEVFLLGLFSLLDAMLDMHMDTVCDRLSLSDNLKEALISQVGPYAPYLQAVVGYEKGDKMTFLAAIKEIGIEAGKVHQMYIDSISFAESVLN